MRFSFAATVAFITSNHIEAFAPNRLSNLHLSNDAICSRVDRPTALQTSGTLDVVSNVADAGSSEDNPGTEEQTITFPPPLSKVDRLKRAAQFWSSALPIVASYYTKSSEVYVREVLLGETLPVEEKQVRFQQNEH